MKKFLFMAVAAIAALSSCSNNDEFEQTQIGNQGLVFTATMEDSEGTRATLNTGEGNKKFAAWEVGDKISINGVSYSAQTAGATTTFKATTEGQEAEGSTYNAYFPADLYNGTTATLPANIKEEWVDGKFNMPMYATSNTTSLAFNNLCGVLKITVKSDQLASVKCITVSSTNCATSGKFTVEGNAAKLTDASNTANTVTVTYTDAVSTEDGDKVFYVAIPAQTYKNLSIAVSDGTTTKVMTTKNDQNITVVRSKIYPITFNGQPTTDTAARTGGNVNWVQLWAGGPKFAEYNVGVTDGKAESYGGYYCWGKATDKDSQGAYKDGTSALTGTDDTATNLWGSNWRMPTQTELQGLIDNCTVEWTTVNNVNGRKFTGKGAYTSNSVFLPAASNCLEGQAQDPGNYGNYWSSTPDGSDYARSLTFSSQNRRVNSDCRYSGNSVRAVLEETAGPAPAPATTGTAKATIGGSQVDVNWVQLWAGGPKFAEYNVGASSATETGSMKTFTDATAENFIWGSNWCTPSKDQMDELLKAATSEGSEKVNCETVREGNTKGFKFTGKDTGYTDNSVFFSAGDAEDGGIAATYWSATADGSQAYNMFLNHDGSALCSAWLTEDQDSEFRVRPVLKN